jgi:hypothetical protein
MTTQQAEQLRQWQRAIGLIPRQVSQIELEQEARWQATQRGAVAPSDQASANRVVGEREEWVDGWTP